MGNLPLCKRKSRQEKKQQCKHENLIKVIVNVKLQGNTKEDQIKQKQFTLMKNDTYEDLKEEIQSLFMIESLEKTNIKMYFVGQNTLKQEEWQEVQYKNKINQLAKTLCIISHTENPQENKENKKPIVIGISGPSGSYKTQISEAFQFKYQAEYVSLNKFYDSFKQDQEQIENKDDPDNFQWEYLENVIKEKIENSKLPYIIVEGFCLFHKTLNLNIFDKLIYLEVNEEQMYKRRMKVNRIAEYKYRELVIPEHRRYLNYIKQNASDYNINIIDANGFFDETYEKVISNIFEKK